MQPFDALTIKAVLQEAKPLLVNRKVEKVQQLGRDEVVISLRSRTGQSHLLLSAHASFGRLCLVNLPPIPKRPNLPNFCVLLRKHLTGATLLGVEQMHGERVLDIVFSCIDEVGGTSYKILTAEIMGRHSNLIFWDKESEKIVTASHLVTREMSRHREVAPGMRYVRPPSQDKPNVFKISEAEFKEGLAQARSSAEPALTIEQILLSVFAGVGKSLAEEMMAAARQDAESQGIAVEDALWSRLRILQTINQYSPSMRIDYSRYSVLSWWPDCADQTIWKHFPSVNDMVEEYFRAQEIHERFQQMHDRIEAELRSQKERIQSRLDTADKHLSADQQIADAKKFGDLILLHIKEIQPGQEVLECPDVYSEDGRSISIKLNPSLTPSQNSQNYYRQFAKIRARQTAANAAHGDAEKRLQTLQTHFELLKLAKTSEELEKLRDALFGKRLPEAQRNQQAVPKKKPKSRLLSVLSSDGWTIYVGRNRQENDELISKVAQPQDIWMHVLGSGGAHVLIKVPSTKQDPPLTTLKEGAQLAARLSKAVSGGKARVVYTQCRFVRKIAKAKPGLVRYENERTLEVDTSGPMPESLKRLYAQRQQ
jgi:predicted ribosome quality control (RQC) complex YloA/Tae2 family protein